MRLMMGVTQRKLFREVASSPFSSVTSAGDVSIFHNTLAFCG